MATPSLTLIDQLRRMVAEPTQDTYTDGLLSATLQRYPLPDSNGYISTDTLWAGAWDANAAAADVWEEKAAAFAADFDFAADGGDYKRSQVQANMLQMARMYRGRRSTSALVLTAQPPPERVDAIHSLYPWIGNLAEEAD
jgi:hypothetical protein